MPKKRKVIEGESPREGEDLVGAEPEGLAFEGLRHHPHPHDDEDQSQASRTGDSDEQLAAGDSGDRDPAEGADEDYWQLIPADDFNPDVQGAPEPPG